MLLRRNLLVVICGVIIASGAVSGTEEKKAVGDEVSFSPENPPPASVSSITWKHIKDGETVKAIEWEDKEIQIPNPRFKDITTLDTKTGKITITKLTVEHSGVYTIDISGKEQTQRFTLTVMDPVPKPVIVEEKIPNDPDVVYLTCKYKGTIIWNNSAGEKLTVVSEGQSITVKNNEGDPENVYSCTFKNDVSEETSDLVLKKDLFNAESAGGAGWIGGLIGGILAILGIFAAFSGLYKFCESFREWVPESWGKKPCIGGWLNFLFRKEKVKHDAVKHDAVKHDVENPDAENPDAEKPDAKKPDAEEQDEEKPDAEKPDAVNPDAKKPDAVKPDAEEQDEDSNNPAQKLLNSDEKNDRGKNKQDENLTKF